MSAGECDGQNDVQCTTVRKARRTRACDACAAPIAAGSLYAHESILYDGYWTTTDRCGRCEVIIRHLSEALPHGTALAPALDCGHDYEDAEGVGRLPPPEVAALAFATPTEASALLESEYLQRLDYQATRRRARQTLKRLADLERSLFEEKAR